MNRPSASCVLAVHDLTEALGFYRDVLGFEVHADSAAPRRMSVSPPSQPDVRIFLQAHAVSPTDGRRLVFLTEDCDTTFERIEAAGAEVMQEPINQLDGTRDCAFLDPSGNLLRFTQPRRSCGEGVAGETVARVDFAADHPGLHAGVPGHDLRGFLGRDGHDRDAGHGVGGDRAQDRDHPFGAQ